MVEDDDGDHDVMVQDDEAPRHDVQVGDGVDNHDVYVHHEMHVVVVLNDDVVSQDTCNCGTYHHMASDDDDDLDEDTSTLHKTSRS